MVVGLQNTVNSVTSVQSTTELAFCLCAYDLRHDNRADPDYPQCCDRFLTYRNKVLDHHSIRLDIHVNLIAVATDDKMVQMFDTKQGL